MLYASAGSKKAHMTKNAGFYIVSLVGKVLFNEVDPFTRTPGIAGKAYIDMHYKDIVINSFENPESSKYI